jgi:hypothetical protein
MPVTWSRPALRADDSPPFSLRSNLADGATVAIHARIRSADESVEPSSTNTISISSRGWVWAASEARNWSM